MEKIFDYDELWRFTKEVFKSIGCIDEHATLAAPRL
jgi:hypothetical protein